MSVMNCVFALCSFSVFLSLFALFLFPSFLPQSARLVVLVQISNWPKNHFERINSIAMAKVASYNWTDRIDCNLKWNGNPVVISNIGWWWQTKQRLQHLSASTNGCLEKQKAANFMCVHYTIVQTRYTWNTNEKNISHYWKCHALLFAGLSNFQLPISYWRQYHNMLLQPSNNSNTHTKSQF